MSKPSKQIQEFIEQGRNLVNNGKANEAIDLYKEAAGVAEKLGDKKWVGYFWQQQGVALMTAEKYEEAATSIERALQQFSEINDLSSLGNAHRDLGIIKTKQKKYEEAVKWFSISLDELSTNTDDWNAIGVTEAKLAGALMFSGDRIKARKTFESALVKVRKQGDWFMEMTTLLGFANLDFQEKKYQQMLDKLWACLGLIYEKGDYEIQKRRSVEIYGLLGKGYEATGAVELARKFREKARGFLEGMSEDVKKSLTHLVDT